MNKSLGAYLLDKLIQYSNLDAIKIGERYISYEELKTRSLNLTSKLIEFGASAETIGIVGQRSSSSYIGILGILFAGCTYTPLNVNYSKERLLNALKLSKIRFLVGDKDDLKTFLNVIGNEYQLSQLFVPELNGNLDDKYFIYCDNCPSFNLTDIDAKSDLAYILYTSGSTGTPKGVQVTSNNVISFIEGMKLNYPLKPGFRASQTFDLSFDPSVSDMFFTWSSGGVLCILDEQEKMSPNEYIKREKINFWNSVPSLISFMYKLGLLKENVFPNLEYSMFCGEQFPKYLADAWKFAAPNSTIENLYGPTEGTIYISRYVYDVGGNKQDFRNSILPIGKPFPNHKVAIIDDKNEIVQNGEIGEICFSGEQITNGYLNDTIKTSDVFVDFNWDEKSNQYKWYKTGDLGFKNCDGDIECIGRKDSQIKIAGRRIEIGEIESVLSNFDELKDIVVVPIRDSLNIVIGCVGFTQNQITKDIELSIRSQSQHKLERDYFPKKIISISEFPLTISGKIDRKKLENMALNLL
jgi:amino acid adenylation domain-containing protein